jgi:DNA-binding LacI/PurR family transcriptional regulator
VEGYRRALESAGIAWEERLVVESTHDIAGGRAAIQELLARRTGATAVFAANGLIVLGALAALREHRVNVPNDLAMVSYDEVDQATLASPFLTVMAQPAETFGRIAMQLLLDRISGRAPERRRIVVLPADLILRESCGGNHGDSAGKTI